MQTIIITRFYSALEASQVLEMPLDRVEKYYASIVAAGKEPVAYYQGPTEPMIAGRALLRLAGLPEPPPTYRPTTRGRRR